MAQPTIQTSFASGEWAPKLRSRVDIQKYHSGAELLRNFYVDYSGGGASTRQGTAFVNQAFISGSPVRIIGFQPSTTVSYVLEFGDSYIRFYTNGAPVLENAFAIGSIVGHSVTATGNNFASGDWVFIGGLYYIVVTPGTTFTVSDLFGNTSVTPTGTTVARVYTLASPFAASDLFPDPITGNPGIKYVQDVTSMIICHPSYAPQILTIASASPPAWSITSINFNPTIATPTGLTCTSTLGALASGWNYGYTVTAVDINGQESPAATPNTSLVALQGLWDSTHVGTNLISWTAVQGAQSYNVYKTTASFNTAIQSGAQYGFIGNVTGTSMTDAFPGIGPDFSQTPPIPENPFVGAGVQSYVVTNSGSYAAGSTVPTVTVAASGAGATATAQASAGVISFSTFGTGGGPWVVGKTYLCTQNNTSFFSITVTASTPNNITSAVITWPGSILSRQLIPPSTTYHVQNAASGGSTNINGVGWGITQVLPLQQGSGYLSPPGVTFSSGTATANAVLGLASAGNPGSPGFIQQRLVLASQPKAVQGFNMSQPGSFFNFNTTNPTEPSDAIQANIIAEDLNDIRSMVQVPTGMLMFTGKGAWLVNGGGGLSTQTAITPENVTAQVQSFCGANDLPARKINYDALYVTNKGNYVRDLNYNIYAGVFTGQDISVLSNHLFFNHFLSDWAYSEEPFKTVWAIREDGQLLSLGYVKEQDMIGWAHHDTNGQFNSVCSVIETVNGNTVDAVYVVVQRMVNGQTVQYIERMADRFFPYGYEDSWSVDCGLQTPPSLTFPSGLNITGDASAIGNTVTLTDTLNTPFTNTMATNNWIVRMGGGIYQITGFTSASVVTATVVRVPTVINMYTNAPFSGALGYTIWQPITVVGGLTQLEGQTVTGVADGAVVPPTVVSAGGQVTLANAATKVTLGLAYTPQLKTLRLDLGQPTAQSKRKKVPAATLRVADTLGLSIGTSFANAVQMKDFTLGNLNIADNTIVNDLYSGDGFVILDQLWQEPGQLVVQQTLPYPATILGVMPQVTQGDTPNARA